MGVVLGGPGGLSRKDAEREGALLQSQAEPAGAWPGVAAAALALTSVTEVWRSLWFCALLAVLAASMLTVTWKRRPYPPSRLGFLMVHVAPSLVLLGILWERLGGPRAPSLRLIQTGFASLLLGSAWMFYLKPWLKRREAKGTRP